MSADEGLMVLLTAAAAAAVLLLYVRRSRRRLEDRLRRLEAKLGEVTALVRLQEPAFSRPLPWTGWTLSAGCLLRIRESFAKRSIHTVVECGAGISTLHLARFLRPAGGRLICLEDDEAWAGAVRRLLAEEGLKEAVTVLHRPLVEREVLGRRIRWYDVDSASALDLGAIDLLLVDGPPGASGPLARLGALPVLASALAAGSEVFLDDAAREDEREILRLWRQCLPFSLEEVGGERPYARLVIEEPGGSPAP